MQVLQKQPVPIIPSGVDQRRERTQLPAGRLLEAIDVHQEQPGILSKRNGNAKYAVSKSGGGSITAGYRLASTTRDLLIEHDSGHALWSDGRDLWQYEGPNRNVSALQSAQVLPFGFRPTSVKAGGLRYYFACDFGSPNASTASLNIGAGTTDTLTGLASYWKYRIVDSETGVEIVPATAIATVKASLSHACFGKPIYDGTFVWYFVGAATDGGAGGENVYLCKFDPANPTTAPVITTFYDAGAAGIIRAWDVMLDVNNKVVFAASGVDLAASAGTTPTALGVHARLNASNGLPDATGTVGVNVTAPGFVSCLAWIKNARGGDGFLYWLLAGNGFTTTLHKISLSTLAISTSTILASFPSANLVAGYMDGTDFVTWSTAADTDNTNAILKRCRHTALGVLTGSVVEKCGLALASEPVQVGSTWYVLAAYDDGTVNAQRGYYLVRSEPLGENTLAPRIVARTLNGSGGDLGQLSRFVNSDIGLQGWVAPAPVLDADGQTLRIVQNAYAPGTYESRELVFLVGDRPPFVELDEGRDVLIPGAWPGHCADGGRVKDFLPLSPTHAPTMAEVAGGTLTTAKYHAGYYTWGCRDSAGDVHETEASPVTTLQIVNANRGIRFTVRNNVWVDNLEVDWFIRIYLTTGYDTAAEAEAATPYLQVEIANDPATLTTQHDLLIGSPRADLSLYHFDDFDLPNDPIPAFRAAAPFGRRVILMDLDSSGYCVSKEKIEGFGWSFSEDLRGDLPGGTGRSRCGGMVSDDRFAIFEESGIWILSGPGPDKLGNGMWEARRIEKKDGCTNPASVVTTPKGLVYQSSQDLGIYCITPDERRVYLGSGVEAYKGRTIKAAVYVPETEQIRLFIDEVETADIPMSTTANLITNGSGESPVNGSQDGYQDSTPPTATPGAWIPTGWTARIAHGGPCIESYTSPGSLDTGSLVAGTSKPLVAGTSFFRGGIGSVWPGSGFDSSNVEDTFTQTISLSAYAAAIDTGLVTYDVGGWFGGWRNHGDHAKLTITWLDADGASLGAVTIGQVTYVDRVNASGGNFADPDDYQTLMLERTGSGSVPAGARSCTAVLTMTKLQFPGGTGETGDWGPGGNNGYHNAGTNSAIADGLTLTLDTPTTIPDDAVPGQDDERDPLVAGAVTCMVFDLKHPMADPQEEAQAWGQWYAWRLPADAVAACVHDGAVHWIDSAGVVRYEVEGQWFDDTNTQIKTRVRWAPLSVAGLQNAAKVYRAQVNGKGRGTCAIQLTALVVQDSFAEPSEWESGSISVTVDTAEFDARGFKRRGTAYEFMLEELTGANLTEGYALKMLSLEVGIAGRLRRVETTRRVT